MYNFGGKERIHPDHIEVYIVKENDAGSYVIRKGTGGFILNDGTHAGLGSVGAGAADVICRRRGAVVDFKHF